MCISLANSDMALHLMLTYQEILRKHPYHPLSRTLTYALTSTLNNPCHTSTEHASSPSAQETSNVCSDRDGGHANSAERCTGISPGRTSKLETCVSRRNQRFLPDALTSGIIPARDHSWTRATLPADSKCRVSVTPEVIVHRASRGVSGMRTWTSKESYVTVSENKIMPTSEQRPRRRAPCAPAGTYRIVDKRCWPACGRTCHHRGRYCEVPIPC
jgi:hypothetical protein